MGKAKKPLSLIQKHLTKEEILKKEHEEALIKVNADNIEAPSWLIDDFAVDEFYKLADELKQIDIITNLDVNNLASYCEAYSNYVKATIRLNSESLTIKKTMQSGVVNVVKNPLIEIQKLYAEECRRFASLCGLTIDSRLKFATAKAEKLNNELENEFGDL